MSVFDVRVLGTLLRVVTGALDMVPYLFYQGSDVWVPEVS